MASDLEILISEVAMIKVEYAKSESLDLINKRIGQILKIIARMRRLESETKDELNKSIMSLTELVKSKTDKTELMESILEVIKLYDQGKLPRPWRS